MLNLHRRHQSSVSTGFASLPRGGSQASRKSQTRDGRICVWTNSVSSPAASSTNPSSSNIPLQSAPSMPMMPLKMLLRRNVIVFLIVAGVLVATHRLAFPPSSPHSTTDATADVPSHDSSWRMSIDWSNYGLSNFWDSEKQSKDKQTTDPLGHCPPPPVQQALPPPKTDTQTSNGQYRTLGFGPGSSVLTLRVSLQSFPPRESYIHCDPPDCGNTHQGGPYMRTYTWPAGLYSSSPMNLQNGLLFE